MAQPLSDQETTPILRRTPLFERLASQARLTAFSGWEMPVQFSGLKQEHLAVRNSAGMFDISHMGKLALSGPNLLRELQRLVPSDLQRLLPGRSQYTVLLNPQGGIIDDLIVYYQGDRHDGEPRALLIINAATAQKDTAWLRANLPAAIAIQELGNQVLLAVQGPQALGVMQPLVAADLSMLLGFGHCETEILAEPGFIARTGYTGEDGFEVMVSPEIGGQLWQRLLAAGVTPCGLGARDTLRLEAALHLYGQDMDETTTPYEAGLGWLVHPVSVEYIGRAALETQKAQGLQRRLVGLQMQERQIARHGHRVFAAGEPVGIVTSGTLTPTLNVAIALAYVPGALSKVGQALAVEIRGKTYAAKVVKKPFYRSPNRPPVG